MSTSMLRLPPLVMLAAVLGLLLSGCADYPSFEREQTSDDQLPDDAGLELDDFDLSTLRFEGSHEGVDYFLVEATDEMTAGGPCLIIDDPAGAVIGCGQGPLTVTSAAHAAAVAPVGVPAGEAEGWTRISENVAVRDAR